MESVRPGGLEWREDKPKGRVWVADGRLAFYRLTEWQIIAQPSVWTLSACRHSDRQCATIYKRSREEAVEAAESYEAGRPGKMESGLEAGTP